MIGNILLGFLIVITVVMALLMVHYVEDRNRVHALYTSEAAALRVMTQRYATLESTTAARAALLEKMADQAYERALKNATEDLRLNQALDFDAGRRATIVHLREHATATGCTGPDYLGALVRYEELEIKQRWGKF